MSNYTIAILFLLKMLFDLNATSYIKLAFIKLLPPTYQVTNLHTSLCQTNPITHLNSFPKLISRNSTKCLARKNEKKKNIYILSHTGSRKRLGSNLQPPHVVSRIYKNLNVRHVKPDIHLSVARCERSYSVVFSRKDEKFHTFVKSWP